MTGGSRGVADRLAGIFAYRVDHTKTLCARMRQCRNHVSRGIAAIMARAALPQIVCVQRHCRKSFVQSGIVANS